MSVSNEHPPQGTPSQDDITREIDSVASTYQSLSIRVQAEETLNEELTSGLSTLGYSEVSVDCLSREPSSQPRIVPTLALSVNLSGNKSDVSGTSSPTGTDFHSASYHQVDSGCDEAPMLTDRPTIALGQIQSTNFLNSNAEYAHPLAIESNSVPSDISFSPVSGQAVYDISGDHMMSIPQTPALTPIQPTENSKGGSTSNEEVPQLDLDGATEDLNSIDEWPPEDLYMVPGDDNYVVPGDREGDPSRGVYKIGGGTVQVELLDLDPRQRIYLPLPNPRNLGTFEVVLTVPYELGRAPVSLAVALPPTHGPLVQDCHHVLQFDVTQESDDDDFGAPTGIPDLPSDGGITDKNSKAMIFVKQLPRLDLVDLPELQDYPCWICQEPYMLGSHPVSEPVDEHETPVRLPCNHVFGERCLTSWFNTYRGDLDTFNTQCPLCRQELSIDQAGIVFKLPEGVSREPEGVSTRDYDLASYDHIVQGNQRFGLGWLEVLRDPELAAELTRPDCLSRDPGKQNIPSLFEGLRLTGAFRSPYVTEEYRAYGNRNDLDVYEDLKAEGGHWTTRWGMLKDDLLTILLRRLSSVFQTSIR